MADPRIQSSHNASSIGITGIGSTSAASLAQNTRARTDVDDIHDLIEDALALSAKAHSVVEAIIGGAYVGTGCGSLEDCPSGILSRMGDRSRDARTQIAMASDGLERLARSFGV